MTNVERARELKGVLDAVSTNGEARRLAASMAEAGTTSINKLGGFSSSSVRELISGDVVRMLARAAAIPDDGATVSDGWLGPNGLRVAIQATAADVWAQEKVFPLGTSMLDDFSTFCDGFIATLKAELNSVLEAVPPIADALGGFLWPLAIGAVAIIVLVVLVKGKATVPA